MCVNSNSKAFLRQDFGRRQEPVAGEMGGQDREVRVNMSKAHDVLYENTPNKARPFVTRFCFCFQGRGAHL